MCSECKRIRRKKIPYGAKRARHWCRCDRNLVAPVSKGTERQKAKKSIKKELKNIGR